MELGNYVAMDTDMSFETVKEQIVNFKRCAFVEKVLPFYDDNQNYAAEIHIGPVDEWGEYEEATTPADMTLELGDVAHYLLLLADYYAPDLSQMSERYAYGKQYYLHRIAGIYKKAARIGGGDAYDVGRVRDAREYVIGGLSMVTARCVNHCISFDTLMAKNIEKLEARYK